VDYVTEYDQGIFAIDSGFGRPLLDAIHLLVEDGHAALIDTATNSCVPRLLDALATMHLEPEQIDYIILTHIHLDHAGAAGQLMQRFPQAKLVVHPRGARHMIDPGKLLAGTIAVYGSAATQRMYGELLPVPAQRIVEAQHRQTLSLNGRELLLLDTPGHARHHICIRDARTGHIFSGDTFGMCYRELERDGRRFVFPTTTPVQFDPAALHRSIAMLTDYQPAAIYVTHFSQVTEISRLAADLHRLIDAHAKLALRERNSGASRHERLMAGITAILLEEAAQQGWALQGEDMLNLMKMDIELNAQGLGAWLDVSG